MRFVCVFLRDLLLVYIVLNENADFNNENNNPLSSENSISENLRQKIMNFKRESHFHISENLLI